jgi:hypothetical protein
MSKKLDKFVGKVFIHPDMGEVEVLKKVPKSRTRLEVKVMERGIGWCKQRRRYVGVKMPSGWMRGQNHDRGNTYEIHYSELKEEVKEY